MDVSDFSSSLIRNRVSSSYFLAKFIKILRFNLFQIFVPSISSPFLFHKEYRGDIDFSKDAMFYETIMLLWNIKIPHLRGIGIAWTVVLKRTPWPELYNEHDITK